MRSRLLVVLVLAVLQGCTEAFMRISPSEVELAQQAWCDSFLDVCKSLAKSDSDGRYLAQKFVNDMYGHGMQSIIFKSPVATKKLIRTDQVGVISFLVGGFAEFPEDVGFARTNWAAARYHNAGVSVVDSTAMAMGSFFFKDPISQNETEVEYSQSYVRGALGELKLSMQFLAIPYGNSSKVSSTIVVNAEDVKAAQKAWGDGVIEIGQYYAKGWDYKTRAALFLSSAYAYGAGRTVLFKGSEVATDPFRRDMDGALSYFVGGNARFPADTGFALKPWTRVTFENYGLIQGVQKAWLMGTFVFWADDGTFSEAQFTFGFVQNALGQLQLTLFMATVPRNGAPTPELMLTQEPVLVNITQNAIEAFQKQWGKGLVAVGAEYTMKGDYRKKASAFVDDVFAYMVRPTMWRPTYAMLAPFRMTREGAVSYLAGAYPGASSSSGYREDLGFALRPWRYVRFENQGITIDENQAIAMGQMFFSDATGVQDQADFVIGLVIDKWEGRLRINLMHTSVTLATTPRPSLITVAITDQQIAEVQQAWGDGIVNLGTLKPNMTNASVAVMAEAKALADKLYGFNEGPVLVKVTESPPQFRFRVTRQGLLSWLLGADSEFPGDRGFAMRPWIKVRFENFAVDVNGDLAQVNGNTYFQPADGGAEVKLEHAMSYFRDVDGRLRMRVQHLGVPYNAAYNTGWGDVVADQAGAMRSFAQTVGQGVGAEMVPILVGGTLLGVVGYFVVFWGSSAAAPGAAGAAGAAWGSAAGTHLTAVGNYARPMSAPGGSYPYSNVPSQATGYR